MNNIFQKQSKGIICIGASRSGTHMTTDILFNLYDNQNKINLGEIYSPTWPYDANRPQDLVDNISNKFKNKFIFASIAQYRAKVSLARHPKILKDFTLVNIRRKDKVAQYISWCVFRAQEQANIVSHSPEWDNYKHLLPFKSDYNDLENFVVDQMLDYAFNFDFTIYYEDVIEKNLPTRFKKNHYPISHQEIVTNYDYVKEFLGNFEYKDHNDKK